MVWQERFGIVKEGPWDISSGFEINHDYRLDATTKQLCRAKRKPLEIIEDQINEQFQLVIHM